MEAEEERYRQLLEQKDRGARNRELLAKTEERVEELVEQIVAESQTRIRFRLRGGIELAEEVGRARR